jgi:glucose/mannose-6-phosphate isomerase
MLDDAKYIAQFDRSNGLAMIAGQASQLRQEYKVDAPPIHELQNIVVAGMGGSAIEAEFIRSWLKDKLPVPVQITRDYSLPGFVNKHTLVIISTYSGNTEEALSALEDAAAKQAVIVTTGTGGQLEAAANNGNYAFIKIPAGVQPRLSVLFGVKALATLFESIGLVEGITNELEGQADWLVHESSYFAQNVATADNLAKQLAEKVVGFTPIIYGGPTLAMPAMKWKIDFNENAKNTAFYNVFSEFNHNEMLGWVEGPKERQMQVIQLHSSLDRPQIKKRFEVTNRLLSGKMPAPIIVEAHGETYLQQMLWTMLLGDFTSAYLAFLNGIDPIPVELIEKFKKEIA